VLKEAIAVLGAECVKNKQATSLFYAHITSIEQCWCCCICGYCCLFLELFTCSVTVEIFDFENQNYCILFLCLVSVVFP
jgi:hypothetical protein